jgi:hypothetical protein
MGTFSELALGTQATRDAEVEFLNGAKDKLAIRVLDGLEEALVISRAKAFCESQNAGTDGDLVLIARAAHRIAIACLDVEDHEKPYFDGGFDQIMASKQLGRDRILYLAEMQELWQDQCSPSLLRLGDAEFTKRVREIALSENPDPFVELRPGLRWSFTRTLALRELESLQRRSLPGSSSEEKRNDA